MSIGDRGVFNEALAIHAEVFHIVQSLSAADNECQRDITQRQVRSIFYIKDVCESITFKIFSGPGRNLSMGLEKPTDVGFFILTLTQMANG